MANLPTTTLAEIADSPGWLPPAPHRRLVAKTSSAALLARPAAQWETSRVGQPPRPVEPFDDRGPELKG